MQNNSHVYIIAEAGVNHNADYQMAKQMIEVAKDSGVDAVKFQIAIPELVMTKWAGKADYQEVNTGSDESQLEMCKKLHLDLSDYAGLKAYCDDLGITFLATAFDHPSFEVLKTLGVDTYKIPSGEVNNLPYLRMHCEEGIKIILSTGMADMAEVTEAVNVLVKGGVDKANITVLHCNTEYPTPMGDVNLKAMTQIKDELDVAVGYSDHTKGIEVPIAAVALGATCIEKHFTLDRTLPGPDHVASIEPDELALMVQSIRNIQAAIGGSGEKIPSESEKKNIEIARRSIVASCEIKKGELLTVDNITTKRPATGLSPMLWDEVIGTVAERDYIEDDLIEK
ncbi:N-acetylneuraminate synthase [Vibrio coralliilyticus]|nr:N-acetylneuraminate synthase [Vibrio sp. SCSIO 43186]USD47050.1 N-acetylneuraminate synthase [Vibrio sp. SCSIO 43145]USD71104.1 N-acetylneuraminate synthase [Vibrio sp. SCSIO 43139]USD94740.1 N-acetylneuraminate synthase [Vibrio coralliilyticus]